MNERMPRGLLLALRLGFVVALLWGWWVAVAPPSGGGHWFAHSDKVKHALAFGAFSFWASVADLKPRWFWAGVLLAYGLGIEWAQSQVPGRDASWGDAVADAVGIGLGLAAARWFERRTA